jgi:peptidyl-prolyl cis-trans isomerase A (cyclophilin A)
VAGAPGAPGSGIPAPEAPRSGDVLARIDTDLGRIQVRLFGDKAPRTVANFVGLAEGSKSWRDPRTGQTVRRPLYEGIPFHRVVAGFAIQAGDPAGDGSGDPGYTIPDEIHPALRHDRPGVLTMANRGPNTGGSQFMITLRALPFLDGRHTIFGEVVAGMDVVEAIARLPVDARHQPRTAVRIRKIDIQRS